MAKWAESSIPDLSGTRALVTGAASGIGYETARSLALRGAAVWLLDCDAAAGNTAVERIRAQHKDAKVTFEQIDLANLKGVRGFAQRQLALGDGIDLLINNAGISATHERRTTVDGFERTFGIGHLGHFALTGQLLPALLKTPAPRVISVSSLPHKDGVIDWNDLHMAHRYTSVRPYSQTKLANLLFAQELQRRADPAGARLSSIAAHPGFARTNIIKDARKSMGRCHIMDYVASLTLSSAMSLLGQPAHAGALSILFAATAPNAKGGGYYGPDSLGGMRGAPTAAKIHRPALCPENARKLWEISERLTGVQFSALATPASGN